MRRMTILGVSAFTLLIGGCASTGSPSPLARSSAPREARIVMPMHERPVISYLGAGDALGNALATPYLLVLSARASEHRVAGAEGRAEQPRFR